LPCEEKCFDYSSTSNEGCLMLGDEVGQHRAEAVYYDFVNDLGQERENADRTEVFHAARSFFLDQGDVHIVNSSEVYFVVVEVI
jgi:hypothetical protein